MNNNSVFKAWPLFIIFAAFLLVTSCSNSSGKNLEGNWETVELLVNGESQEVLKSNIQFVQGENGLTAKGRAGVNLYKCRIEVKGKNFKASYMENTGFMGTPEGMKYEDLFFTALMTASSFKIEKDVLSLFVPEEQIEMHLKKSE